MSQHMDDKSPLKGARSKSREPLKFLGLNDVSAIMVEAGVVKFCTQADYAKS